MYHFGFLLALEVKEGLAAGNVAGEREALQQMQKEVSRAGRVNYKGTTQQMCII